MLIVVFVVAVETVLVQTVEVAAEAVSVFVGALVAALLFAHHLTGVVWAELGAAPLPPAVVVFAAVISSLVLAPLQLQPSSLP